MENSQVTQNRDNYEQGKKRGKARSSRLRGNTELGNCVRKRERLGKKKN